MAGWTPEPLWWVWIREKSLTHAGFRTPELCYFQWQYYVNHASGYGLRTETADDPHKKYVTDKCCVLCEVRTKSLYVIQIASLVKYVNWHFFHSRHIPCNSNIVKWLPRTGKHGVENFGTNIFFNIKMKEFVSFSINFFLFAFFITSVPRGHVCHFWGVNWKKNVNDGWRRRLFPWVNGSHPSTVNITKNVLAE